MSRTIRVAALQIRAHDRAAFAQRADAIFAMAQEACAGAELVVLPEATFPAYVLGDADVDDAAVTQALARLRELAARTSTVIVAGAAVRHAGALRNAAVVIDRDGSIAGRADKLFLWHFDRRWFEAGDRLRPIATGVGRLGVLVCADGRLPTIARTLVDAGAEMLVMPTAWVTSGRDPAMLENVQADVLARVRAFENGVPFVAANKCGTELGVVAYCGKSQIVDASGEPIAMAGERDECTLKAVVTTGTGSPQRTALAQLSPRGGAPDGPVRLAISATALPAGTQPLLELLDDAFAVAPGERDRLAALDRVLPTAFVDDATVLDPAGLVAYRRAGYRLAVWTVSAVDTPWLERLARARALELRLYLVVLDARAPRAFAVDPDGATIAGTFDGYAIASFALDPRRTNETALVPGTDVADGLERVASIVIRADTATA